MVRVVQSCCGKRFLCKNRRVEAASFSRCRSGHTGYKSLRLSCGYSCPSKAAVLIQSCKGNQHHADTLCQQLAGATFWCSDTKYGFKDPALHGKTRVAGNQLCMFNMKYCHLPYLARLLSGVSNGEVTSVLCLEDIARLIGSVKQCFDFANRLPKKGIIWLGDRRQ